MPNHLPLPKLVLASSEAAAKAILGGNAGAATCCSCCCCCCCRLVSSPNSTLGGRGGADGLGPVVLGDVGDGYSCSNTLGGTRGAAAVDCCSETTALLLLYTNLSQRVLRKKKRLRIFCAVLTRRFDCDARRPDTAVWSPMMGKYSYPAMV